MLIEYPLASAPHSTATTRPIWDGAEASLHAPLAQSTSCEVCVIGAGVAGLCTAYELARTGRDVLALDAGLLANTQTAKSTAHLVTALDERYFLLEKDHGKEQAAAIAAAHMGAIAWLEATVKREEIECGFGYVEGVLVVSNTRPSDADKLLEREEAASRRCGVAVRRERVSGGVAAAFPSGSLRFAGQAQLQPRQFLEGLGLALERRGGRLCCDTYVTEVNDQGNGFELIAGNGLKITAKQVVFATHGMPHAVRGSTRPVRPTISFCVSFEVTSEPSFDRHVLLWDGYWDDDSPYHFVRFVEGELVGKPGELFLVVGGEDEEAAAPTIDASKAYDAIETWTRAHFPFVGARAQAWWGRIFEPKGEFALIGNVPDLEGAYLISGDSGNGFTYAGIAAQRIAALTAGLAVPQMDDTLFDPRLKSRRFTK